ncbi:MAG: ATP-binding protein [Candidatus Omnitrophota bacterium]
MENKNLYYELMFETMPYGVYCLNNNKIITHWNNQAEAITQYTKEEAIGKKCDFFIEQSCQKVCQIFAKDIKTPIKNKECIIKRKDGKFCLIFKKAEVLTDKNGQIIGVVECFEDISERKREEGKIIQLAENLENTFNSLTDIVSVMDQEGRLLMVNQAFARAYNIGVEECRGLICHTVVHGTNECIKNCPYKKVLKSKKQEFIQTYDSRLKKYVEIAVTPILNEKQEMIKIIHVIKDITESKRNEQLKDDLISTVSHELRTPLTTIREVVSQILDGILGPTTAEQRDFLLICLQDVDRLMRIINDLLDISKLEAQKVELYKDNFDMISVIKSVQNTFTPRLKEKKIEMITSFSGDQIEVNADRDKIIQVLTNLMGNALKFTQKGKIEISVSDQGEMIQCAVIDTGKGLTPDEIVSVFDKFKQFDRQYGPGEKGTGLGLAICKGIIELHHGQIWVESEINKGTKFIFTLPKQTTQKQLVLESLGQLINKSSKEERECAVFVLSLNPTEEIIKQEGDNKITTVLYEIFYKLKQIIGSVEPFLILELRQIILIADIASHDAAAWQERLKRIVKNEIFKFNDELELDFSYGWASFPKAASNAEELFALACRSMVSEKSERLKKKILIADDSMDIVFFMQKSLKNIGYNNLNAVNNGEDVFKVIDNNIPDLIILDMQMPKMNGYEVIGRLKEDMKTKDIPIMIVSGYSIEFEKISDYVKKKAIPVIGKPMELSQLKKLVRYLL